MASFSVTVFKRVFKLNFIVQSYRQNMSSSNISYVMHAYVEPIVSTKN